MKIREYGVVYAIGSIGYRFIEVLWRGRTHWTMGLVGGICFLLMYILDYTLKNVRLRNGVRMACITKGSRLEIPNGNSFFDKGDRVIVVTDRGKQVYQFNDIFQ